jgi:hypothetical protein
LKILLQGVSIRRYGTRGSIILIERSKQTPVRGLAPAHPTTPGLIRVSYPGYGLNPNSWSLSQHQNFQRSDE